MTPDDRRTVLTTGANSGIGLATAIRVAELGFRSVGSVRSEEKGAVLREAAAASGVEVDTVLLDVTDAERCAAVIDEVRPWGLVNNAGYSGGGAIEDIPDDEIRHQLETMVVAPMRLARLSLPHMRAAGEGRIVNVSSLFGVTTAPFSGWYQASKHALEAAADALRLEVARDGIKVLLVEPGGTKTAIWDGAEHDLARREGSRYDESYRKLAQMQASLQRTMADPKRTAAVIGKALTARSPRPRQLVGYDAHAVALAFTLVPTAARDGIYRRLAGL